MQLRSPRPDDFALLASWIPDAHACQRWAGPLLAFPFTPQQLEQGLQQPQGASLVLADEQGRMLGFGQYWVWEPGSVHLGRLLIDPARRGQGLGRKLLRMLMPAAAQATGAQHLSLRVYRDNGVALSLYLSLGFVEDVAGARPNEAFLRKKDLTVE